MSASCASSARQVVVATACFYAVGLFIKNMKILLSWLQDFISLPSSDPRRLADDLASVGFPVDSITEVKGDAVLDVDVTTNRPDCLSHYGIAREVAALYNIPLSALAKSSASASQKDSIVRIVAKDLCRRYCARMIRGVKVGPSPDWLVHRLEAIGQRSINNVADATNYVLMAYGHPLHAFDLDRLKAGKIIVRSAKESELLRTLDGVERSLCPDDLVIADARRPVALAGIMGGQDSEISNGTENVFLESAWFNPVAIRRTAKRQGMHTEASHRFERGADIGIAMAAANHCAELIVLLAGGNLDPYVSDVYPKPYSSPAVLLCRSELLRHLGMEIPAAEVEQILHCLGFSLRPKGRVGWKCSIPSHRVDVSREIDLVEEVARLYGYDRFPLRLPVGTGQVTRKSSRALKEDRLRNLLLALGYDEAISSVLVGRDMEAFGEQPMVALSNPLSEEASALRNSLVPGLLDAVQWNLNRGQDSFRLFEFGSVYRDHGNAYSEPQFLALVATGQRSDVGVNKTVANFDFLDLKGDIEQLLEISGQSLLELDRENLPGYLQPGSCARLIADNATIARWGEFNPLFTARWKLRQPVFIAEIFLDTLYQRYLAAPMAQPISRFPAVDRDFSLLLPDAISFSAVQAAIADLQIPSFVALRPVEIIRGGNVPAGRYSLLLRVSLQSQEATLTEAELQVASARIMDYLEKILGAQIRR